MARSFNTLRAAAACCLLAVTMAGALMAARADAVTGGVIRPGHGAAGVTLGMTRADVVARLGRPSFENRLGFMQYGQGGAMFDVYRASAWAAAGVRMLGISGSGFRLADGNRVFAPAGLRRLRHRFGARLIRFRDEDGAPGYRLPGRLRGRRVLTDFFVDGFGSHGRVLNIFIRYA
jgi:hypothetical protein